MPGSPRRLALAAVLVAAHSACVGAIRERCSLITENKPAPALPRDFARLDDLLRHRALQMWHDAHQLNGSATRSFRIYFGDETLPLICGRIEQARALAAGGQVVAAGRKYQALLVLSQIVELAIAVHATVEYADQVKELSLTISRTQETFGNQMKPLLEAALSEDPARIEQALRESAPAIAAWLRYLERWTAHIQADAKRMVVAKAVWDITIGVIAVYETAGALSELAATGGPPVAPSLVFAGGGAAALEVGGVRYLELAEAIRKLIASGALDAGVVAALSTHLSSGSTRGPGSGLTTQSTEELRRSKVSLERLIQEHRQKLTDYRRDPFAYDNQGTLKNATESLRPRIIEGRILALEKQIVKLEGELQKVNDLLSNLK